MSFWNKLKTGLKIAKVGVQVAAQTLPAGKAASVVGTIAKGSEIAESVVKSVKTGEK